MTAEFAIPLSRPVAGKIVFAQWIERDMVRAAPEARFVFGDNVARIGYGGQAAAMRNEPNAIGVATKRYPSIAAYDYFSDDEPSDRRIVDADIDRVAAALAEGRIIFVPRDGLGTGLSELPQRAPKLHQHIVERFRAMVPAGLEFPWSRP